MKKIRLCLFCKNKHCKTPMEGRLILPLGGMTTRSEWLTCEGCGTRMKYGYLVKEPDEAEAV